MNEARCSWNARAAAIVSQSRNPPEPSLLTMIRVTADREERHGETLPRFQCLTTSPLVLAAICGTSMSQFTYFV